MSTLQVLWSASLLAHMASYMLGAQSMHAYTSIQVKSALLIPSDHKVDNPMHPVLHVGPWKRQRFSWGFLARNTFSSGASGRAQSSAARAGSCNSIYRLLAHYAFRMHAPVCVQTAHDRQTRTAVRKATTPPAEDSTCTS